MSKIQGWFHFKWLYDKMIDQAPAKVDPDRCPIYVEVGCWKGKSAFYLAQGLKNAEKNVLFYCVDHWEGSDENAHKKDEDVKNGTLFDTFLNNMAPVKGYFLPVRMGSVEAAETFADGSIDFLFLDAGHTYLDVRADLQAWLPKMKKGAVMSGDDYATQVRHAVHEWFPSVTVSMEGRCAYWETRITGHEVCRQGEYGSKKLYEKSS